MVNAAFAVGAIGVILLLGVFLKFYSLRKAYPLTLLLLIVGILVGPIMGWFKPQNAIEIISPFVTLALIMVLFDTGYGMKLNTFFRNITKPLIFGVLAVLLTITLIAIPFKFFLGVGWYLAILFGALLASTDLTIIAPMLQSMNLRPKLNNLLEVESTVNSILSAVAVNPVAVNVTGDPIGTLADAVTVYCPIKLPNVNSLDAWPVALVVCIAAKDKAVPAVPDGSLAPTCCHPCWQKIATASIWTTLAP